jgi:hypothetical protein
VSWSHHHSSRKPGQSVKPSQCRFATIHCEAVSIVGVTALMVTLPQYLSCPPEDDLGQESQIGKKVVHEVDSTPGGVI